MEVPKVLRLPGNLHMEVHKALPATKSAHDLCVCCLGVCDLCACDLCVCCLGVCDLCVCDLCMCRLGVCCLCVCCLGVWSLYVLSRCGGRMISVCVLSRCV